jgi:hypothetical protein
MIPTRTPERKKLEPPSKEKLEKLWKLVEDFAHRPNGKADNLPEALRLVRYNRAEKKQETIPELTVNQWLAFKYYKAYGALCIDSAEHKLLGALEKDQLAAARNWMFAKYKRYDPNNSFDVSLDYAAPILTNQG